MPNELEFDECSQCHGIGEHFPQCPRKAQPPTESGEVPKTVYDLVNDSYNRALAEIESLRRRVTDLETNDLDRLHMINSQASELRKRDEELSTLRQSKDIALTTAEHNLLTTTQECAGLRGELSTLRQSIEADQKLTEQLSSENGRLLSRSAGQEQELFTLRQSHQKAIEELEIVTTAHGEGLEQLHNLGERYKTLEKSHTELVEALNEWIDEYKRMMLEVREIGHSDFNCKASTFAKSLKALTTAQKLKESQ